MASKKQKKRTTGKKASQITGKDAFILSFVARNGLPNAKQRKDLERYLTPHVARAAFSDSSSSSSNRKGSKTLSQLKSLAQSNNSRRNGSNSKRRTGGI
jgi:hypothetical protein